MSFVAKNPAVTLKTYASTATSKRLRMVMRAIINRKENISSMYFCICVQTSPYCHDLQPSTVIYCPFPPTVTPLHSHMTIIHTSAPGMNLLVRLNSATWNMTRSATGKYLFGVQQQRIPKRTLPIHLNRPRTKIYPHHPGFQLLFPLFAFPAVILPPLTEPDLSTTILLSIPQM